MTETSLSVPGTQRHVLPSALLHDLRTPLNQIIGYSEMLMEQAEEQGLEAFIPDLQKTCAAGKQLLTIFTSSFHPSPTAEPNGHKLEAPAGKSVKAPSISHAPQPETAGGSLLVVDDNEANRDVLTRRLARQGYQVATAENGREALEMLKSQPFDLILLDIMMPGMDGYEVLQRLKADDTLRHIPVIMISALSELDSVVRCIEMGAEDYLPKPFNPILLKARIGASLEKKRGRDRETLLYQQLQLNYRRLEELEKLRGDLTQMIIHDLRTPLHAVLMGTDLLGSIGTLNDRQRRITDLVLRGAKNMMDIVNDILDVSKMEGGSIQLERIEFSASAMVENALDQVAPLITERNLKLATEFGPDLPLLIADEPKLLRTLVNLLGNAIKFTPVDGTVTVVVQIHETSPALEFSVLDTGKGIPPESFERIFEKFGQVESQPTGRVMSTGLGLTFCKLVVEAHGGTIGVESVPGEGSKFRFTIPLLPPPAD